MSPASARMAASLLLVLVLGAGRSQGDPAATGPTITSVSARPATVDEGDVIELEVATASPAALPLRYGWNLGDGTVLAPHPHAQRTFAAYGDEGEFEVMVTVEDTAGRTTTGAVTVHVRNVDPVVERVDRGGAALEGSELTFHARATDPGDDRLRYGWDFGDGTVLAPSAGLANVKHSYEAAGSYTLTLNVEDGDGGAASWTEVVTVGAGFLFDASGAIAVTDGRGDSPFVAGLSGVVDGDGQVRSTGGDAGAGCFVYFGSRAPTIAGSLTPGVALSFTAFLPNGLEEGEYPIATVHNELPVQIVGPFEREWASPGTFYAHAGAISLEDGAPYSDSYHGAGGTIRVQRFEGDVLELSFSVNLEETFGPLDVVGDAYPPARTAEAVGTFTHRVQRTMTGAEGSMSALSGAGFGDWYLCAPAGRFEVEEVVPAALDDEAAHDVPLVDFADPEIAVRFSEPVDLDTVLDAVVLEWRRADGGFEQVPIMVMGDGDRGLTISPLDDLMDGVVYRARVAGGPEGARGRDSELLDGDREWLFETIVDLGEERHGITLATTQVSRDAPLVAGKPTETRVYLNWREKPQVHPEWQTRYATFDVVVDGIGRPATRVRVKRMDLYGAEELKHALDSVNFYGWRPDRSDSYHLSARATQVGQAGGGRTFTASVEVPGVEAAPALVFDYYFVRVGSWRDGVPLAERRQGHRIAHAGALYTDQTFPVPGVTARYRGDVLVDEKDEPTVEIAGQEFFLTSLASVMRRDEDAVGAFAARLGATDADVVVALLPEDVFRLAGYAYLALGTDPRIVAIQVNGEFEDAERYMGGTVAHEIGHAYGLRHNTDCPDPQVCSRTGRSDAIEGTRIAAGGMAGWNKSKWSGNAQVGRTPGIVLSLMHPSGILDDGQFITNTDYAQLQATLPSLVAAQAPFPPVGLGPLHVQATRVVGLQVTGWIDVATGEAHLHRVSPVSGHVTAADATAPYLLETYDADGAVLGRAPLHPIGPDPWHPGEGAERHLPFEGFVPAGSGATRVALLEGGRVLVDRRASPAPPTLTLAPGPRTVAGPTEVAWTASDADDDALTFDVDYAPDGRDWRPLALGLRAPSLVLDPAALPPGVDPTLRVVASDGFHQAIEYLPLSLPPEPVVLSTEPAPGASTQPASTVTVWTLGALADVGPDALVVERIDAGGATRVPGTVVALAGDLGVRFEPTAPLAPNASYRATFGAATWTFTTDDGPPARRFQERNLTGAPLAAAAATGAASSAGTAATSLPETCAGLPRARWEPLLPAAASDVVVEEVDGTCRISAATAATADEVRSFAERTLIGNALILTANRSEGDGALLSFRGAGLTGQAVVEPGPPTRLTWTLRPE